MTASVILADERGAAALAPRARPRISIVTPSFNHARFIGQTVRSVLGQGYPDLEYLVLDGGSTDGTGEVLEPYRPSLAYYRSHPDDGQAAALAEGFARCTGEILGYVNSDDMLAPDALAFVADFFEQHPAIDAIYSHRLAVDEAGRVAWYWILPSHSDYRQSRWDLIPQETCFWRRGLLERAGNVDPSFRFAMDYELFVRYMRAGRFARVDRFLGAFRQHAAAKTSTMLHSVGEEEIRRVWRMHGIEPRWFHRLLRFIHCRPADWRGRRYARSGRALPGSLPGVGWAYDQIWRGRLSADA